LEEERETPIPIWVTAAHLLFLGLSVLCAHYTIYLVLTLLFFIAFVEVTEDFQRNFALRTPMLVGFFLAGLVIHGGLQQWWIAPLLGSLKETPLFLGALGLTAFNDNAAITYLCTLVPSLTDGMKYAAVAGAVAGGGLTVIANAPNPAGQSILQKAFSRWHWHARAAGRRHSADGHSRSNLSFVPMKRGVCVTVISLAWWSARAQDLEPRAYSSVPIGMNFLITGYGYTAGNVVTDPALPLQDAEVEAHAAFIGYARSLDVLGRSGKFAMAVPHAWVSGSAQFAGQPVGRQVTGFGDPLFSFSVNLYGAPALTLEEFQSYQPDWIIGASVRLGVPLGQYDSDKLLNIGAHRWSVKPEIGVSKTWGDWTLELSPGVVFFTDNDDFFGGKRREQDPIYAFQAHLSYTFRKGMWAAIDGTYYGGGRTTVDGVVDNNLQSNTRLGATFSLPLSQQHSLKFYGSTGVSTRTGTDFQAVGIAWQIRWGGKTK
jgi:hypothetical protein